jgi:glycosyltransferase involved in cell wall biosynthesis
MIGGLIPALDCAATIGEVVRGVRRHVSDVLVVDDGSRDSTADVARAAGAEVVRHAENLGKGAALTNGMRHLAARGLSHALTLDGDGQHLPDEIPKLLREAAAYPEALIIGARQIESEVAAINRFGNHFADLWVRILTGRDVDDTQSGFRVYPLARILALEPEGQRFDFETEIVIRALRAGIDVRSVGVRVYYPPPAERISHYDRLWDTVGIIRMVLRLVVGARWG